MEQHSSHIFGRNKILLILICELNIDFTFEETRGL